MADIEELEQEFSPQQLEDFKNPDVDPKQIERRKRCIKRILIASVIVVIIILIPIIIKVTKKEKKYIEIYCKYQTFEKNEEIDLINIDDNLFKELKFKISINGSDVNKNTKHKFKKPGTHKVTFKFEKQLESLGYLFDGIENIIEVDLSKIKPEAFSNMSRLFAGCDKLKKIKFDKLQKNISYMEEAFSGCNSLEEINLTKFNTDDVDNMGSLFSGCHSLTSLNLESFNTSNVITMETMKFRTY